MVQRAFAILVVCGPCCIGVSCMHGKRAVSGAHEFVAADDLIEVWAGEGYPPVELPAPLGFQVTPWGAYSAAIKSRRLSLKHRWACYRDGSSYYIFDTFCRDITAKNALQYGVKVNGVSGLLDG